MEKRKATFTVTVPIQIVFVADNDVDADEFEKIVEKETYRKLVDGNFEVFTDRYDIAKKRTHYTDKELKAQKKIWDEIFNDVYAKRGK